VKRFLHQRGQGVVQLILLACFIVVIVLIVLHFA
jgi:hypothetical protein